MERRIAPTMEVFDEATVQVMRSCLIGIANSIETSILKLEDALREEEAKYEGGIILPEDQDRRRCRLQSQVQNEIRSLQTVKEALHDNCSILDDWERFL